MKAKAKGKGETAKVVSIKVPTQFAQQMTAWQLGWSHGFQKAKRWQDSRFINPPTATAYAAGYQTGCAARAAQA